MTDLSIADQYPHRPPAKSENTMKVNGRNKAAIDFMVFEGLKRKQAAEKAGLKDHALYVALSKPHVKAYYNAQLEVLRTSERARNLHRLAEIRDAGNNMPAVQAIGMLERLSSETQGKSMGSVSAPGLTVQIVHVTTPGQQPTVLTDASTIIEGNQ